VTSRSSSALGPRTGNFTLLTGRAADVQESQNVLSRTEPAGQANDFDFIPTVQMESQHPTGAPTCHDFPRFVIISEKSRLEVGNR